MASFQVKYEDGSIAKNTKCSISVDGGGMVYGFTDSQGHFSEGTSGTTGKIIVNGKTVHEGSLSINVVYI